MGNLRRKLERKPSYDDAIRYLLGKEGKQVEDI